MIVEKSVNAVMVGIIGAMIGFGGAVKYYHVEGLWGSQNQLSHVERAVVPVLAKAATAAAKACEANSGVALDNDAAATDLVRCPKAPPVAIREASGIVPK